MKFMKENIFKKLGLFAVVAVFSMLTTMAVAGSSIYSIIESSTTINDKGCFASETFSMPDGEQIIMVHAAKAQSAGVLYAVQHRKGWFFWSTTSKLSWEIAKSTTMRYCSKTFTGKDAAGKGKYYYDLTGISPDTLEESGLSMTATMAYIKIND